MKIALLCFVLCVLVFIAMAIMNRLNRRWLDLPHFVYNSVGGVMAICSITDFKKAFKAGQKFGDFTWVKETVLFAPRGTYEGMSGVFTGRIEFHPGPGDFFSRQKNQKLFVPFISSRYRTFDDQAKMFIKAQDPEEFATRKRAENSKADFRFRFVEWMYRHDVRSYQIWSFFLALFSVCVLGILFITRNEEKDRQKQFSVFTTPAGLVQEVKTTLNEATRLPMYHYGSDSFQLISGKVAQVQALGETTARACLLRVNETLMCGFSSPTVKVGEQMFVRSGHMMESASHYNSQFAHHVEGNWLISKREANALIMTGKFTIIE